MARPPSPVVQARLPGWKDQYGEVLHLWYGETELVFRYVGLDHHDQLEAAHSSQDPYRIDEAVGQVLQDCLLWPEDFDLEDMPQTDFLELNNRITKKSPFSDPAAMNDILERYRERYQTHIGLLVAFVQAAFPGLPMERIQRFTAHEAFRHLAIAEIILERKFPTPDAPNKRREAPTPLSPDQVRAAQAQRAMERREAAIARAKASRARRNAAYGYHPQGYDPALAGAQPDVGPASPSEAPLMPPVAPVPTAPRVPDYTRPMVQDFDGAPKRRVYSNAEILKEDDTPIDFEGEANAIRHILDDPNG